MTGIIGKTLLKKKSKNKKTTDLLVTWPPSWIAMVKRGLMSQASPNELRVSRVSYFHMHKKSEKKHPEEKQYSEASFNS